MAKKYIGSSSNNCTIATLNHIQLLKHNSLEFIGNKHGTNCNKIILYFIKMFMYFNTAMKQTKF